MKKKSLAWALALIWLLGPIEPVFAESDIISQFPNAVLRSPVDGSVWAVETTRQMPEGRNPWGADAAAQSSGPWTVEMWSRGRRRYKHFNGHSAYNSYNSGHSYHPSTDYSASDYFNSGKNYGQNSNYNAGENYNHARNYNSGNNYFQAVNYNSGPNYNPVRRHSRRHNYSLNNGTSSYGSSATFVSPPVNYPDGSAGQPQHTAWLAQPQDRVQSASWQYNNLDNQSPLRSGVATSQYNSGNNQFNSAGDPSAAPRKPDKFADTPQIDESGIRHFGNGRHHDLKAMPMEQALDLAAASDAQIKQDQAAERARKRQQARHQRFMQNY